MCTPPTRQDPAITPPTTTKPDLLVFLAKRDYSTSTWPQHHTNRHNGDEHEHHQHQQWHQEQ